MASDNCQFRNPNRELNVYALSDELEQMLLTSLQQAQSSGTVMLTDTLNSSVDLRQARCSRIGIINTGIS